MALFSGLFGTRQAQVAVPRYPNDLDGESVGDVLARALNTPPALAYLPQPASTPKKRAARPPKVHSHAPAMGRRYQLNVRISGERRAELRQFARQKRITITDAVDLAIAELVQRQ